MQVSCAPEEHESWHVFTLDEFYRKEIPQAPHIQRQFKIMVLLRPFSAQHSLSVPKMLHLPSTSIVASTAKTNLLNHLSVTPLPMFPDIM